jgi:hypothetical protein
MTERARDDEVRSHFMRFSLQRISDRASSNVNEAYAVHGGVVSP